MTMTMISPYEREVSPAEQLCQSPRLVPPRGGGVSSRKLAYDFFFLIERLHIVGDGHRRATRGPRGRGHGQGVRRPPTLMARVWAPSDGFFRQYFLLIPKITSVKFHVVDVHITPLEERQHTSHQNIERIPNSHDY